MDIAKVITDKIISELEKGVAPWVKPWAEDCEAHNPVSKTIYRGINQLWLGMAGMGRSSGWMTFKQAADAGYRIRKGCHGVPIVFWKTIEIRGQGEDEKTVPILRSYYVFNVDDVEGYVAPAKNSTAPESCDPFVDAVVARLSLEGGVQRASNAFYQATKDAIGIPSVLDFKSPSDYAATILHECVHATGHAQRLDRRLANRFGSEAYAFEELIAELGAAMLCMHGGIDGKLQHASYIGSWLRVLRGDKTAIIKAASKAQAALDYLTHSKISEMPIAA
jgi:antirestriction protein ArdC